MLHHHRGLKKKTPQLYRWFLETRYCLHVLTWAVM